ncbi:MAG: sulfatase-like hydrolase/transferase [Candidatus Aminicenantes bacterium]|nr:MAG: sulfatase-like hydrolase/transferase [Candidatus Aminicenantes bacterium]
MKKTFESLNLVKGCYPHGIPGSRVLNPMVIMLCFLCIFMNLILLTPKQTLPASRSNSLNILLVTIDTLRADYLSCYGNKLVKTPNIDQLAKEGILFNHAFAHNVVTLPSHINILTGTYPLYHGVRDNAGFRLDEAFLTLAEVLKQNGYKTSAFIGAFPLDDRFGLAQGFDLYDDFYGDTSAQNDFSFTERRAEKVIEPAIEWINQNKESHWFCWVHLFDPHAPYNPPQSFMDKYPDNFYGGEVAYTDFALGNLLKFLRKSEVKKNTLIVVTSDHGEGLGDHKEKTHGVFAYNSTLHIPLIFYQPKIFREPKAVSQRVRHIDIMPTILDILKIKIPKEVQGLSLIPLIENPRKERVDDSYFEALTANLNRNWAPLQGILSERFKYIELPVEELYDVESDYPEENNLAGGKRSVVEKLNKKLKTLITKYSSKESREIKRIKEDAETLKKLRALGYVGNSRQKSSKKTYSKEDDPKQLIELDNMSHEAINVYLQGSPQQAIEIFTDIINRRPDMSLTYSQLSFVYRDVGQIDKAIETLEKGVALNLSNNQDLLAKLGIYLQETGQFDRSMEILQAVLTMDPEHAEALNYLGICHWRSGQHDKAIESFEKLIVLDSGYASAYNNLGSVYLSKKQYDLAAEQFKKAIKYDQGLAGPYNGLGVIYANKGDDFSAIKNWKKAVELDSKQYDALYNLGILLTKMDRFKEAVEYLEQFVNTAPSYRYAADIEKMKQLIAWIKQRSRIK